MEAYIAIEHGGNYLLDSKLELVEKELDPTQFLGISRQAVVRIDSITDIMAFTNSRLHIKINS